MLFEVGPSPASAGESAGCGCREPSAEQRADPQIRNGKDIGAGRRCGKHGRQASHTGKPDPKHGPGDRPSSALIPLVLAQRQAMIDGGQRSSPEPRHSMPGGYRGATGPTGLGLRAE